MVKQLITILFSTFYIFSAVGVQVNIHFCANELQSIELYTNHEGCCCGEMGSSMGCCSDESYFIQASDEQRITSSYKFEIQQQAIESLASESTCVYHSEEIESEPIISFTDSSPPPKLPLWKLNCSLTYYG